MIILGSFGRNTRTNYCSKIREEKVTDWTTWKIVHWPKGTYCILRKGGKCPKGLSVCMGQGDTERIFSIEIHSKHFNSEMLPFRMKQDPQYHGIIKLQSL